MALIAKRGSIPQTPHTEFYFKDGVLALEEVHGTYGFSGAWARKMHVRSYPTCLKQAPELASFSFHVVSAAQQGGVPMPLQPQLIQTDQVDLQPDCLRHRIALVTGPHTRISLMRSKLGFPPEVFFRNGERHEIYYIHRGEGHLTSEFGKLPIRPEHYLIVPKGTTYRIDLSSGEALFLVIEALFPIEWPQRYINSSGQATMEAPIVESEIIAPELDQPIDQEGDYPIYVQHHGGVVSRLIMDHHPFDVCGWEGALYPFAFNIRNHHGIAREIHTSPPVHQTFQAGRVPYNGFSLCSFVPQMEGWHAKEVPAPYAHHNVDSDEVMFFCNASYGARKGIIREGSFTFHPGSTPHSPHGQAALKSLASRGTLSTRLAVMLDTYFESLELASSALPYCEPEYATSWHRATHGGGIDSLVP